MTKKQHLLIDIGNTSIHFGLAYNSTIIQEWRIYTQKNLNQQQIQSLPVLEEIKTYNIRTIGLASVVPILTNKWKKSLEIVFSVPLYLIDVKACKSSFKIKYDNPTEIGADRLCNILSCQRLNIQEAIIIDFGTATTFDIYHQQTYWGGVICLGILSSLKTLYQQASMLKQAKLYWNPKVTGKNTGDAIRNGTLYGAVGQIKYLLEKIKEEHQFKKPEIILTGGLSSMIQEQFSEGQIHPHFTLLGIDYFIKQKEQGNF